MSYPTVFANLAGGVQPASLLDTMFNICGQQGNIPCTASGTNAITLTPDTNFFLPTAYANYGMFSFSSAGSSTGPVTLQVGGLGFLRVFTLGSFQANANDIIGGETYIVVFNQSYDSGAGGWQIVTGQGNQTIQNIQLFPQGYLTLVSGTPSITGDTTVSAGSPIFYTPFMGATMPLSFGAQYQPYHFSEIQLVLDAAMLANNIYDVFGFLNAGAPAVGTGPSWAAGGGSVTVGACARGTGAGSTQISRAGSGAGFFTNTNSITLRNGSNTFSVGANLGIYLASIFMDSVNGQLTCHRTEGQNRKWGVWNYFNRLPLNLIVTDPAASWSTTTTFTTRPANNNTNNLLTLFTGVAEETVFIEQKQNIEINATVATVNVGLILGCGLNATNSFSGSIDAASLFVNFLAGGASPNPGFIYPTTGS